jgi:hypothetical protein
LGTGPARDFTSETIRNELIMKTKPFRLGRLLNYLLPLMAGAMLAAGCVIARHAEQTEKMLSQAGFKQVAASSETLVKHLQTLPVDKLTVVKLKGKTFYVFPDPAHNQLYVGNPEEYQSYQQIVLYNKTEAQNRVMAALGEDTGDGDGNWVEWSNSTGWAGGSF